METLLKNEQLLAEIREANLTYLMLAQNLIRADRPEALYRLGLSQEAADLIVNLSPAQVLWVAQGNMLLCRMRVDVVMVWNLLTNHGLDGATGKTGKPGNDSANKLHASILMASRYAETL